MEILIEKNQAHQVSLCDPQKQPYLTVTFDAPLFGVWSPDKKQALQLNNDDDAEEVDIWDFVSLADCVSIVTNGKNWSSFFEEMLVRPEETKIAGGKEAKTQWILRLSAIKNKLSKESYSVPVDEYSYVKSIYDWIMEMLTL